MTVSTASLALVGKLAQHDCVAHAGLGAAF
jgi:hypothetical protein